MNASSDHARPGRNPLDRLRLTRRQALAYGPISVAALFTAACSASTEDAPSGSGSDDEFGDTDDPKIDEEGSADSTASDGATADAEEPTAAVAGETCDVVAFPEFQEGPFYINTGDVRSDVTEGLVGAATVVRLRLIDAATCAPLTDLPVDIWSAGTDGAYSGVDNALVVDGAPDTRGTTYMRGRQITDAEGRVEFQTLFPGWYPVTPPHFHFTSPFDGDSSFTWQFFIDDAFSETVYTSVAPYTDRGVHTVRSEERDPAMILLPTGTAAEPVIDATVAIDLERLGDTPSEFS